MKGWMRVDWFRVLADLRERGVTVRDVSDRTGIPRTTIHDLKSGKEPRHSDGEKILAVWSEAMMRTFVPTAMDEKRASGR